ncbi:MAG: Hpt domain-containing protein [Parvularculaceae bacterium]|nr:Hpt domain-containing protein [Parvularculaceae bacterium]
MTTPIDYAHLDKYVCGDRALLDEILSIFQEQVEGWVQQMTPELEDDAWRHAAHSLKGASRGVGAWAVGDIAEEAEAMVAGAGDRSALLARLASAADAAIDYATLLRDGKVETV